MGDERTMMKYDDAKNYLESLKNLSQEALNKADEIDELRAIATSCTVQTDKECVQSSSTDKLSAIVGRIVELEKRIESIKKIYWMRRKIISKFALTLDNEQYADFIENRYIREKSIYVVSAMMDIPETSARRIQRRIIIDFCAYYDANKDKVKY